MNLVLEGPPEDRLPSIARLGGVSSLNYEIWDESVELDVVEVLDFAQFEEIFAGFRGAVSVQHDFEVSEIRLHRDVTLHLLLLHDGVNLFSDLVLIQGPVLGLARGGGPIE